MQNYPACKELSSSIFSMLLLIVLRYCVYPKYLYRQALANRVNLDQTNPEKVSVQH